MNRSHVGDAQLIVATYDCACVDAAQAWLPLMAVRNIYVYFPAEYSQSVVYQFLEVLAIKTSRYMYGLLFDEFMFRCSD